MKNIEPRRVQDKPISDEYIRSAIRYLDPDEKGRHDWSLLLATILAGLIWGVLFLILLRAA